MTLDADQTKSGDDAEQFDVVVVGAGAGGVAAAARLNKRGYKTLLVESRKQVGGRASTVNIDGFGVNTGAQIFELGGENQALFDDLGIEMRVRRPKRPLIVRTGRLDIPLQNGPMGFVVNKVSLPLIGGLARRWGLFRPRPGISLDTWLHEIRAPRWAFKVCRNLSTGMLAAELPDVEAVVLFDYLTRKGGMATMGAHPKGAIGPWLDVIEHFEATGGTLWLDTAVTGFEYDGDGRISRVGVRRDGIDRVVSTRAVVSNMGPMETAEMQDPAYLPPGYASKLRAESFTGTLITINFATRQPLKNLDTLVFFAATERLCYAAAPSAASPQLAPDGWHLYAVTSTPSPANEGFDLDWELDFLRKEATEQFPGFADARVISTEVCTGDWPAQRAIAGRDWPNETPIANLWNVGDAARPPLGAGVSGCVWSGRLAVEQLANKISPARTSVRQ